MREASHWMEMGVFKLRSACAPGVVACLTFAFAVVVPAPPAVGGLSGPAQPEHCPSVAETTAKAVAATDACDREVEVLAERTEWASTFALPGGSMRLDTSIAAVRTDVSGEWEPVDPSVVEGEDGLVVASAVAPMTFSDGTDGVPLARIERDGHEVVFDAPFDLTTPSVDGSQVTYPGVLPGVDLVVTVNEDATGFSEVLRVESPQAAAHPALAELTFDVQTSDGIELQADGGAFAAVDEVGEQVFISPVPVMWDSSTSVTGAVDRAAGPVAVDADPAVAPAPGAQADLTRGGKPATWKNYGGQVIERPDGIQVGLRSTSRSGGSTIDIRIPGQNFLKIHIG